MSTSKRLRCGPRTRQCGGRCLPYGLFCHGSIRDTVHAVENSIKDKPVEHAFVIDPQSGEIRSRSVGDRHGVNIPNIEAIKGCIVTHNHPSLASDRSSELYKGQSFSAADILFAAKYDAKEMRAVTATYRHSMVPNREWPDQSKLSSSYKRHYFFTLSDLRLKMLLGQINKDQANAFLWHQVNQKVARDMGMKYSRTYLNHVRADAVRCSPGNKPCGKRCIPNEFKCRNGIGIAPVSAKSLVKQSRIHQGAIIKGSTVIGGVAATTVGSVLVDVKKNVEYKGNIRIPPNGLPDEITKLSYDSFKPGDIVMRTFETKAGKFLHYAVYYGKKEDGNHYFFQGGPPGLRMFNGSSFNGEKSASDFVVVKDNREKPFTPEQIKERIDKLLDLNFDYALLQDNCETIARGTATGKWESLQAKSANPVSRAVVNTIQRTAFWIGDRFNPPDTKRMTIEDLKKRVGDEVKSDSDLPDGVMEPKKAHKYIMSKLSKLKGTIAEKCYEKLLAQYYATIIQKSKIGKEKLRKDSTIPVSLAVKLDQLKCSPGNKPCGKRCIPNEYKCRNGIGIAPTQQKKEVDKGTISKGVGIVGGAVAAGTIGSVLFDLNKNVSYKGKIRKPPGGKADDVTSKTYDKLIPGDVVVRSFDTPTGTFQHFGVYYGKKEDGHYFFEASPDGFSLVNETTKISKNASDYMKIDVGERPYTPEEIIERIDELVGYGFDYKVLSANCETIARGVATGKWESLQADTANPVTRNVSNTIHKTVMSIVEHFYLPEDPKKAKKLTVAQAKEYVDVLPEMRKKAKAEPEAYDATLEGSQGVNDMQANKDSEVQLPEGVMHPDEAHKYIMGQLKKVPGRLGELCYEKLLARYYKSIIGKSPVGQKILKQSQPKKEDSLLVATSLAVLQASH